MTPKKLANFVFFDPKLLCIHMRKALKAECPVVDGACKNNVASRRIKIKVCIFILSVFRHVCFIGSAILRQFAIVQLLLLFTLSLALLVPALVLLHALCRIESTYDSIDLLQQL